MRTLGSMGQGLSAVFMPQRPFLTARKAESSPRWMKIRPSISSPSRTAQPRPCAGSISSLPSQENSMAGFPSRSTSQHSIPPLA